MIKKYLFIVLTVLWLVNTLSPHNRNIRFRHLSLKDGLSQTTVYCILQDSKGFMWIGTQDGLNKYDGYTFEIYRPDPENPNSISHNIILSIHEDRRGALWIGTQGDGLNKFDRETETFTHFHNEPKNPGSLSNRFVGEIYEDNQGTLWVGTNRGLNKYHPETGTFTRYLNVPGDPTSLSHNWITTIYQDRSGVLRIGTRGGGFNEFDPKTGTSIRFRMDPGNSNSLSSDFVTDIFEDHSEELWIGTNNGLNRFDRETGRYTVYRFEPGNPHSLTSSDIARIYEDHAGVLWIGTRNQGLNTFDRRTERFTHYKNDPNNPFSLSRNLIRAIYEDGSGVLWIGLDTGGVDRFDRETERFKHYFMDPGNPNSLSSNFIYTFFEDSSGALWIGTNGGGLNKFDRKKKQFTHYRANPAVQNGLSSDYIYYIFVDSASMMWLGTNGAGLDKFDREAGTFKNFRTRPNGLGSNFVRVMYEDSSGLFWIGTNNGFNRFDRETETFYLFRNIPNDPGSLGDNSIRSIFEDRDGILWVGTGNGGLNKFNREKETFTRYVRDLNNPSSLGSNNIQYIYQDPSGMFWLATFGGGLDKFDPKKGICIRHYREKDGLPNDAVYGILPDEKGSLWLSTNKGLSKFDPRTETFKNYTPLDGLQSFEYSGTAFYKNSSGEMFFGGINGFNAFYPNEIKDNKNIPRIVFTGFQIFNRPVGIGGDSPLKKHISETGEITLSYDQNVFSFNFVALDYTIPGKNQYKFMMEGFDKEWRLTDASMRSAGYTNLDPGKYRFRVKGSNNDGVWNEKGTSIKIIIKPPFWQTWWFRVLLALLTLLLGVLLYRGRMKRLSRKTRLEAELMAAQTAQMSIMPQSDPRIEGFYISGICVPAHEVGGDFFDYMWLNPEKTKFGIAVGDVSGKAMKAAMTAVLSSGMIYSKIEHGTSVKEIMTLVNRPLFRKTDKKMFTALCLVSLDLETKEFVFTNAGLSEPLLKSRDSSTFIESLGPRLPLGSFKDSTYRETRIMLNPQDVVVLYTDGIPESRNQSGEFYGEKTLKRLVEKMDTSNLTAAEIKENIIVDVKHFSGAVPQHDDMTVVVIKLI